MTKYKYQYKFEKSWQKWLSGQHLYTIVSIGIPMEVAARFKRATFKLSCKTQAKRKKYRLTPIAFPHGNEPFNCKQNRFPRPPVGHQNLWKHELVPKAGMFNESRTSLETVQKRGCRNSHKLRICQVPTFRFPAVRSPSPRNAILSRMQEVETNH